MNNKTILVTGASRGIGQACAIKLAEPNTTMALLARTIEDLQETAKSCQDKGAIVHCFAVDLSNIEEIEGHITHIKKVCGPIHTLVNNAGIWLEDSFLKGDMKAWDRALDVNLKSVIHLTRYAAEDMGEGSSLVFIASIASKKTYAGGTNYCAAKFGLLGFTGALFEDLRESGIKVCSIFPGIVNTDMHANDPLLDKEKMIEPTDIADAVHYVINTPSNICPTELVIHPQKYPKKR